MAKKPSRTSPKPPQRPKYPPAVEALEVREAPGNSVLGSMGWTDPFLGLGGRPTAGSASILRSATPQGAGLTLPSRVGFGGATTPAATSFGNTFTSTISPRSSTTNVEDAYLDALQAEAMRRSASNSLGGSSSATGTGGQGFGTVSTIVPVTENGGTSFTGTTGG
ncbi:MAG TPA: hypothetical protein PKD86_10820, partial [Gemmatales bacterium]|nr:hypothetical protein [Gemmatales bacterium]